MGPSSAYCSIARPRSTLGGTIAAITLAFQVGTGGLETAEFYTQRGAMGYRMAAFEHPADDKNYETVRNPVDDLQQIRAILKPSMGDLAKALGVSRQAVYDWLRGRPIMADNAARVAELARAVDVFAAAGVTGNTQLLRRPISAGRTLFDIAREGGSVEDAARTLVERIGREQAQRERLAARLAGRRPLRDSIDDYGTPMLNEQA